MPAGFRQASRRAQPPRWGFHQSDSPDGNTVILMQNFFAKCGVLALLVGGFVCTGDLGRLTAKGARLLNATTVPQMEKAREPAKPLPPQQAQGVPAAPLTSPPADSPSLSPASSWSPPETPAGVSALPPANPAVGSSSGLDVPRSDSKADPAPTLPPPAPSARPLSAHPTDAPVGWPADVPPPPANALSTVTLASLEPGDRVFVWLSRAAHGGKHVTPHLLVAFDIVDATAAEVLEHRHSVSPSGGAFASGGVFASGGAQATSQSPPRRVRIVENPPKSLLSTLVLGRAVQTNGAPRSAGNSRQIDCGEPLSVAALAGSHASSSPTTVDHLGVVTALAVAKANPE